MPRITILPHPDICPNGASLEAEPGENLCRLLLKNHIEIEHACELSRACTTCHVIVRKGFQSLEPSTEDEDDLLDRAWGLTSQSRLSCQVQLFTTDLEIELPRYTINHARENH
jgi:ferredoxin, 2Fe-2S